MEIIIVAGLPGSGKTTWARKQIASLECAHLLDDPSVNPEEWELVPRDLNYLFITDPYFCIFKKEQIEKTLLSNLNIEIMGSPIRWVCMENNYELSSTRSRARTENFSKRLRTNYIIPLNSMVIANEGYQSPWWAAPIFGHIGQELV